MTEKNIEETEDEKNIPDITPEQEAAWDGPKEQTFDEEDPPCEGYWNDCDCADCQRREEEGGGDLWTEPDGDDDDFDEDEDEGSDIDV